MLVVIKVYTHLNKQPADLLGMYDLLVPPGIKGLTFFCNNLHYPVFKHFRHVKLLILDTGTFLVFAVVVVCFFPLESIF